MKEQLSQGRESICPSVSKSSRLPIVIEWVVIHGKALGRTIGFPTANIHLDPWILPDGVFVVRVSLGSGVSGGMASYRETFTLFEVHIFDFSGDLYDSTLSVEIIDTIRGNRPMNGLADLTAQLHEDEQIARSRLITD